MNEVNISSVLTEDGSIREDAIAQRVLLSGEAGGVVVERLLLQEPGVSVIRKTMQDAALASREAGLYAEVLPLLPLIYPPLLAYGQVEDGSVKSLVYADVGDLNTRFDEPLALELIGYMAGWHAIKAAGLPLGSERGPRPDYEELAAELIMALGWSWRPDEGEQVFGVDAGLVKRVYDMAQQQPPVIKYVLSHGDLHAGNYGRTATGKLVVTNWAYMHRNSPYWDLYHMLDMPSPTVPRLIDDAAWERLLEAYWKQAAEGLVPAEQAAFMREYGLFAAVFSLWRLQELEQQLGSSEVEEHRVAWMKERELAAAAFQRCAKQV